MENNEDSFHVTVVLQRLPVKNRVGCHHFQGEHLRLQVMVFTHHIKARTRFLRIQVPVS